jgi:hypothetical protein
MTEYLRARRHTRALRSRHIERRDARTRVRAFFWPARSSAPTGETATVARHSSQKRPKSAARRTPWKHPGESRAPWTSTHEIALEPKARRRARNQSLVSMESVECHADSESTAAVAVRQDERREPRRASPGPGRGAAFDALNVAVARGLARAFDSRDSGHRNAPRDRAPRNGSRRERRESTPRRRRGAQRS